MDAVRAAENMLGRVASEMSPKLRKAAVDAGWPKRVADQLEIQVHDGNLVGRARNEEDQEAVDNQEFGALGKPPKPALFNFFGSHEIRKQFTSTALDSMNEFHDELQRIFRLL